MNKKKTALKKWDLRLSFLALREKISLERRKEAHQELFNVLSQILKPYSVILSFCSTPFEINTWQINEWILQHKKLVLPRVEGEEIIPYEVKDLEKDLEISKWKIKEPLRSCSRIEMSKIDCVLVPGVCFDTAYHRIGFGKGHYDRFLEKMPQAHKIGIGYKEQQFTENLPAQDHDVQLKQVFLF
ncbi:MAG: 5-formyltetrahydrofolate cyclo-ligase [Chlamydiales bacterium]|nr:5-formyltetrahydrofolate cyclo-ligase [Chlamydiales bacterium]